MQQDCHRNPKLSYCTIHFHSNHSSVQEDDNYTICGSTGRLFLVCYIKFVCFRGAKIFSVPSVDPQRTEKWGDLSLTKICVYHNCRQSGSQSFPKIFLKCWQKSKKSFKKHCVKDSHIWIQLIFFFFCKDR